MKKNIKHFFLLTALAAGTIHFVNRFINMTADIKNILKAENGNFYDWKNGQIYYTKRGSGSPLLLIHDLNPVSSSYEWCNSKTGKETYCLHTGLTWMWTLCKTVLNLHQLFICSACDGFYPKCNWRKNRYYCIE